MDESTSASAPSVRMGDGVTVPLSRRVLLQMGHNIDMNRDKEADYNRVCSVYARIRLFHNSRTCFLGRIDN